MYVNSIITLLFNNWIPFLVVLIEKTMKNKIYMTIGMVSDRDPVFLSLFGSGSLNSLDPDKMSTARSRIQILVPFIWKKLKIMDEDCQTGNWSLLRGWNRTRSISDRIRNPLILCPLPPIRLFVKVVKKKITTFAPLKNYTGTFTWFISYHNLKLAKWNIGST